MPRLTLYGTVTSPYVRRVRIVALELGVPFELVDTATDAGQAELRRRNPLWKVPTAELDDQLLFDSSAITSCLMDRHGPGPLVPQSSANLDLANRTRVIDGALDALINVFYLKKDGVSADAAGYLKKQIDRAAACLEWLDAGMPEGLGSKGIGLYEIAVVTALEWMSFRDAYPVERHANLKALVDAHAGRASFRSTAPPK